MRVTDRMTFDNANAMGSRARERLERASELAGTGVRVSKPGDDPAAAALITIANQGVDRARSIAQSVRRASDELGAVDGALDAVGNVVSRARELAVQLANGSYNAQDRAAGGAEVRGLVLQAVSALNARVGNRYVLGGTADGQPPFDTGGNYSGDAGVRQIEVAPGVQQDVSVRADVALKGAGGGVDVLATLQSLATALAANDVPGVTATLTNLEIGTSQIALARSQAGSSIANLDIAEGIANTAADLEKKSASDLGDADLVDAASQFALAQRALEAALTVGPQTFKLSLLNSSLATQ